MNAFIWTLLCSLLLLRLIGVAKTSKSDAWVFYVIFCLFVLIYFGMRFAVP